MFIEGMHHRRQKHTSVDRYCLCFECVLKACILMKVERKEERQVEEEREDESAQVWI